MGPSREGNYKMSKKLVTNLINFVFLFDNQNSLVWNIDFDTNISFNSDKRKLLYKKHPYLVSFIHQP